MRHLFYNIVTAVTEYKTGLDHTDMTFDELFVWIETSKSVAMALNAITACLISLAIMSVLYFVFNNKTYKKIFQKEEL